MDSPSGPVGWADLPDEIVEHVFETLSVGDYIRLGLVSTSATLRRMRQSLTLGV